MLTSTLEITGTILGMGGAILVAQTPRKYRIGGYTVWLVSNVALIAWAAITGAWGILALFAFYLVTSTWGLVNALRAQH